MKSQRALKKISAPRRKARGQGHERRGEILAAARSLFLKEGVDRVTIRALCARVGVTAPALYRHFKDKREIIIAICNETFGKLLERFRQSVLDLAAAQAFETSPPPPPPSDGASDSSSDDVTT